MPQGNYTVARRIEAMAMDLAPSLGVELEDVWIKGEGRRRVLRVTIDKEGGVSLEDCAAFSRALSALLDVEDPIAGPFTLEVTSPGMDRPLRNQRAFEKSLGKLARVILSEPIEGETVLIGTIEEANGDKVVVKADKGTYDIPFGKIKKARLEVTWGRH